MKSSSQITKLVIGSLAVYASMLGCGLRGDDCENKGTCAPSDTGGASGSGASKGGGTATGGATSTQGGATSTGGVTEAGGSNAAGTGTGSTTAGGGLAGATGNGGTAGTGSGTCTATCGGATPHCESSADKCVACRSNSDCADALASRCDATTGTCAACSGDDDCSQIAGKGVCLTGSTTPNQCVQCTGKKYSACGQSGGKPLVCDSLNHTCATSATAQSSGLCKRCISDAQCMSGQYCLQQKYKEQIVGYFCFWRQGDANGGAPANCVVSTNRPYVNTPTTTSIDGEPGTFCTLSSNGSTCLGVTEFRTKSCASNIECGLGVGSDSQCVQFGTVPGENLCTMTCDGDVDCKPNYSCLDGGSLNYCSLTSN